MPIRNFRFALPILVCFLLAATGLLLGASDEQTARRYADQRWFRPGYPAPGQELRIGRIQEAPELERFVPTGKAFRVTFENPNAAFGGQTSRTYTVVVADGKALGFEYDEETAEFLSLSPQEIKSDADVAGLVEAFSQLLNWKPLANKKSNGLTIKKENGDWVVTCTFVTDPYLKRLARYRLRVSPDGKMRVLDGGR